MPCNNLQRIKALLEVGANPFIAGARMMVVSEEPQSAFEKAAVQLKYWIKKFVSKEDECSETRYHHMFNIYTTLLDAAKKFQKPTATAGYLPPVDAIGDEYVFGVSAY